METRSDLKPKTLAGYESLLRSRILPTFAEERLGWIRTIDIEEWVSAMDRDELSASRVHQAYHLLSSSLKAAARSGIIRTNPAVGVRLPKMEQREMLFLDSSEELERHLETFTGPAVDALVFTVPRGQPIRLQNFRRRVWAPAVHRAGLPASLRIHDMRHTAASLLVNAGVPIKSAQDHLGHSSITVTLDRFSHLYPETRRNVATVLDGLIAEVSGPENRTEADQTQTKPVLVEGIAE